MLKTATILVYHVFGTRHTNFAAIFYRGNVQWDTTENASEKDLFERAKRCASQLGFTHYKLEEGGKREKLEAVKYRYGGRVPIW